MAAGRRLPAPPPGEPGPFSLADPDRAHTILSDAGFTQINLEAVDELMYFGADADEAFEFVRGLGFTQFMLRALDDNARNGALDALRGTIDAHDTGDGVRYTSAAWVITGRS